MNDRTRTFECNKCYSVIAITFPSIGQAHVFRINKCPVCGARKTLNDIENKKEDRHEKR